MEQIWAVLLRFIWNSLNKKCYILVSQLNPLLTETSEIQGEFKPCSFTFTNDCCMVNKCTFSHKWLNRCLPSQEKELELAYLKNCIKMLNYLVHLVLFPSSIGGHF